MTLMTLSNYCYDQTFLDGVEKMNDMVNEDSESGEQSPSLCSSWPYNDEQGKFKSYPSCSLSYVVDVFESFYWLPTG